VGRESAGVELNGQRTVGGTDCVLEPRSCSSAQCKRIATRPSTNLLENLLPTTRERHKENDFRTPNFSNFKPRSTPPHPHLP
jgi:hypothetical protein